MSETIQGNVTSKSRAGTGIQIDKGQWYNGTKEMLASVSWKDQVEVEVDGKQVKSVKVLSARDVPSAPTTDYKDRQHAIEWQSARRDAITLTNDLITNGVVALPAAKDKKYDAYMALFQEVSRELYTTPVPDKGGDE